MNYSVLSRFQWIRVDANILETMLRKAEEKRSFWYVWTRCQSTSGVLNPLQSVQRDVEFQQKFSPKLKREREREIKSSTM